MATQLTHAIARLLGTALAASLMLTALPAYAQEEAEQIPPEIAEYIAQDVPEWADAEAIQAALIDAGDNWGELAGALSAVYPGASQPWDEVDYNNMAWLVAEAPHLDRLELTAAILTGNLKLANEAATVHGYDRDSDFFRRYVLNYRLDDEPVTAWRGELARRYAGGERELAALVERVAAGFAEHERGYYGNLADPVSVDNARAGTGRELAILTAAALRSQGWGTRFVSENLSGKSWVEVYTGDTVAYDASGWTPVYPTEPSRSGDASYALELCGNRIAVVTAGDAFGREQVTSAYSELCAVKPRFTQANEPLEGFEHWTICAWEGGYFKALDDLGYPHGDMDYPLSADASEEGEVYYVGAPGEYRLECGVRYPGGIVHYQHRDFTAEPGGEVVLTVALDAPADMPADALAERQVDWVWEGEAPVPDRHLIVIYDDAEPSVRALELLEPYLGDPRVYAEFVPMNPDCIETHAWIRENLKVKEDDPKPVVILVIDSRTVIYRRGYDLSIAEASQPRRGRADRRQQPPSS